jgi:hypothetical protein
MHPDIEPPARRRRSLALAMALTEAWTLAVSVALAVPRTADNKPRRSYAGKQLARLDHEARNHIR